MLMIMGMGALALFQGLQVYRMQKQIQRQNDAILDSARTTRTTRSDANSEYSDEDNNTRMRGRPAVI